MSLLTHYRDPRTGRTYRVAEDSLDIAKRIQTGDGLMWEGDPRMFVLFDDIDKTFNIWRHAEDNSFWHLKSWKPEEWDQRVFLWLCEHDTRKVDVLGQIHAHNAKVRKANDDHVLAVETEAMKFLDWCDDKNIWDTPVSVFSEKRLKKAKG